MSQRQGWWEQIGLDVATFHSWDTHGHLLKPLSDP
jgi:hypothetical protein